MKTVTILGITGSFGQAMARALKKNGWQIQALLRDPNKLPTDLQDVTVHQGSISQQEPLKQSLRGSELIVYGINPANYNWKQAYDWLDQVATLAEAAKIQILFPGNVYSLNPFEQSLFDEECPHAPPQRLGKIRQRMEQRLHQASQNGARVMIVRMGDFLAAESSSSWFNFAITARKNDFLFRLPGPASHTHTWAYLPDAAANISKLVEQRSQMQDFEVFNYAGHRVSWQEWGQLLEQISGKSVKYKQLRWPLFRPLTGFSPLFRGLYEMRYLWTETLFLDDHKMRHMLGQDFSHSDLKTVLVDLIGLETRHLLATAA